MNRLNPRTDDLIEPWRAMVNQIAYEVVGTNCNPSIYRRSKNADSDRESIQGLRIIKNSEETALFA